MRSISLLIDSLRQDLKYAWRGLRTSPGFAGSVIVALALGIGANAAMFGVVDRLMFRPYPNLEDPSTVHRIYLRQNVRGTARTQAGEFPYTRYTDIKNGTSSFTHHAAFLSPSIAVGIVTNESERRVGAVSAAFWDFFAAPPVLGRFFSTNEDTPPRGADAVAHEDRAACSFADCCLCLLPASAELKDLSGTTRAAQTQAARFARRSG